MSGIFRDHLVELKKQLPKVRAKETLSQQRSEPVIRKKKKIAPTKFQAPWLVLKTQKQMIQMCFWLLEESVVRHDKNFCLVFPRPTMHSMQSNAQEILDEQMEEQFRGVCQIEMINKNK